MTSPPRTRAAGSCSTWLVGVLLAALGSAAGCAPRASSVPLGLGPLALAEQSAQAEAQQKRPKKRPPRAPVADVPAEPVAKAEPTTPAGEADAEGEAVKPDTSEPALFEGTFAGDDVAVYRLTGFPEREERDDKAKIRIEKAAKGSLSVTLINSADGSDLCALVARVEGNAATIESGQPCFSDGSEGSPQVELTSGRVVLEGDRLKMDAEGTLSLSLPDQELEGELSYTFTGERQ